MTEPMESDNQTAEANGQRFRLAVPLLLCGQIACICLLQFGDIGFDHPGKFGLDFDDLVLICVVYGIVLIAGLACSVIKKHWLAVVAQVCIPIAVLAFSFRPEPQYDAAQYQNLKGKSKSEVETILGTRGKAAGFEGHPGGNREFVRYGGMTVTYSPDGKVIAVIPKGN
jgi:hypothetical protein